jgi:hypothetical protein
MSICSPCTRVNNIAQCTSTIVIGTVTSNSTLYNVYFRSLANGMIVKYTTTSSGAGLLTLTPIDGFFLASNHLYEIFVNKTNSSLVGEDFTIGTTTANCFTLMLDKVNDETYTSQTLSI